MSKIIIVLLMCLITGCSTSSSPLSIYQAINKAGYQRMLTQRIAKCYLSIVFNTDVEEQKASLAKSVELFEHNFLVLQDYAPTERIKDQFSYIEILWQRYKRIVTSDFTVEQAATILEYNNTILEASNDAVELLVEYAVEQKLYEDGTLQPIQPALAITINHSGKQRMLSQRMALYATAIICNIGNIEHNKACYKEAMIAFTTAHQKLLNCPDNTPEILQEYKSIDKNWNNLKTTWTTLMSDYSAKENWRNKLTQAIQQTDVLLLSLDKVVSYYELLKQNSNNRMIANVL